MYLPHTDQMGFQWGAESRQTEPASDDGWCLISYRDMSFVDAKGESRGKLLSDLVAHYATLGNVALRPPIAAALA